MVKYSFKIIVGVIYSYKFFIYYIIVVVEHTVRIKNKNKRLNIEFSIIREHEYT